LYTLEGKTAEMVIYGIPTHVPDEFVLTSLVEGIEQESEGAALVTTRNSVYRLTGQGRHYRLPLISLTLLREGQDPAEVAKQFVPQKRESGYVAQALAKRKRIRVSDQEMQRPSDSGEESI
jgi:hypothetical protein